ncbi:MAG: hypothetical protein ABTQ73_12830 [Caldilineales bacterium]
MNLKKNKIAARQKLYRIIVKAVKDRHSALEDCSFKGNERRYTIRKKCVDTAFFPCYTEQDYIDDRFNVREQSKQLLPGGTAARKSKPERSFHISTSSRSLSWLQDGCVITFSLFPVVFPALLLPAAAVKPDDRSAKDLWTKRLPQKTATNKPTP